MGLYILMHMLTSILLHPGTQVVGNEMVKQFTCMSGKA